MLDIEDIEVRSDAVAGSRPGGGAVNARGNPYPWQNAVEDTVWS